MKSKPASATAALLLLLWLNLYVQSPHFVSAFSPQLRVWSSTAAKFPTWALCLTTVSEDEFNDLGEDLENQAGAETKQNQKRK